MALIRSDHGRSTALVHGYDEDTQSVILIRAVLLVSWRSRYPLLLLAAVRNLTNNINKGVP